MTTRIRGTLFRKGALAAVVGEALAVVAARTVVTWTMTGRNGFAAKAIGLVMNMGRV